MHYITSLSLSLSISLYLSLSLSLSLYIYIYIMYVCVYIYIYIYTYICLHSPPAGGRGSSPSSRTQWTSPFMCFACMYVCIMRLTQISPGVRRPHLSMLGKLRSAAAGVLPLPPPLAPGDERALLLLPRRLRQRRGPRLFFITICCYLWIYVYLFYLCMCLFSCCFFAVAVRAFLSQVCIYIYIYMYTHICIYTNTYMVYCNMI